MYHTFWKRQKSKQTAFQCGVVSGPGKGTPGFGWVIGGFLEGMTLDLNLEGGVGIWEVMLDS